MEVPSALFQLSIVTTDASKTSWGAALSSRQPTDAGHTRKTLHINVLKLKAAFPAIQSFLKHESNTVVKLRLDNTTTVSNINNQGATRSPQLLSLTLDRWNWCLRHNIYLKAEYLPGTLNVHADRESKIFSDSSDSRIRPQLIRLFLKDREIDLFASRLTNQLTRYVSWRSDPNAYATDAFTVDWSSMRGYAFPPFNLISRSLLKVKDDNATSLLVTPIWQAQHW